MMQRFFKEKLRIVFAFVIMTAVFIVFMIGTSEKKINSIKKVSIDMYSSAVGLRYDMFNKELSEFENVIRNLSITSGFSDLAYFNDELSDVGQLPDTWQIYSRFSAAIQENKYVTDAYIIFKNNDIQISNKKVVLSDDEDAYLSINSYKKDTLKTKAFSGLRGTTLIFEERVFYNGKSEGALLYCTAIDSESLSGSTAIGVAVIPINKIYNALQIDSVLQGKAEIAVYSGSSFAYESSQFIKTSDYTVIDCDDNRNFSWAVYIENDFFTHTQKYRNIMIVVFAAYIFVFILFILAMIEKHIRVFKKSIDVNETIRIEIEKKLLLTDLFVKRMNEEAIQRFRDRIPDFPRPCIVALFKLHGADTEVIHNTLRILGAEVRYVSNDANGYVAAFLEYRPDENCLEEIKACLNKFIEHYKKCGVNAVVSLTEPCMDINTIYDAAMSAAMMFKYNEYDNLICTGNITSEEAFFANDCDNDKILMYILQENAFEANKVIYSQWYELSQNPSFGDEIEQLFITQTGILATVALKTEYEKELPKYDSKLSVTELALVVASAVESLARHISEHQNESVLFNDVIRYIDDNFTDSNFSQTDVKDKFSISSKIISKITKQKKNMLFSEYVESLRIEKARYILEHSDIKISDVSKMCGYGTNDAFYKAFNKKMNTTPGSYRRQNTTKKQKKE